MGFSHSQLRRFSVYNAEGRTGGAAMADKAKV
jgi:hypothetical protein